MPVKQYWKEINESSKRVTSLMHSYWHEHSDWGNWQFWFLLLCLLVPLVVLLIKLDRNRTFEILFFGYTVHILWTYTDLALIRQGYIDHYYFLMPFLPQAFGTTASILLFPLCFFINIAQIKKNLSFYGRQDLAFYLLLFLPQLKF
ncbi:Uncharacterised protein [Mycobacteroides abscessus subsp. abscessus]|nr:Uncharacterised protein [Mycobacteroides abscessus subsp. abscessus]